MLGDVTFALRSLRRAAGLTTASVLVLGLGIGGTTAIWSVVDALVVHPLAIRQLDRVAAVWSSAPRLGFPRNELSGLDFLDWQERSRSFAQLAAIRYETFDLTGQGDAQQITGADVTTSYFDVLEARPLIGRTFTSIDDQLSNRVAVLSARLWVRQFGADSSIVGRAITLNGIPYSVIGVAPPGIEYPAPVDMWIPLATATLRSENRGNRTLLAIGRLAPGRTVASAGTELTGSRRS